MEPEKFRDYLANLSKHCAADSELTQFIYMLGLQSQIIEMLEAKVADLEARLGDTP